MPTRDERGPAPGRTGNRLLDRLPGEVHALLAPSLVPMTLALHHVLIQAEAPIPDIFFPTTAVISTLVVLEGGDEIETGIAGSEGMVGLCVALGLESDFHRAVCQVHGDG